MRYQKEAVYKMYGDSFGESYIYYITVNDKMSKEYLMKFVMSVYVRHCLRNHIVMTHNVPICMSIEICRTN